ncbi:MAG: hypothetical protein R2705_22760 [Ilumatobacteraceae bacterium]
MLTAKVEFPSLLRWLGEEFDDVRSVGCEPLVVGEGEQYVGRFAPVGDVDRSAVDCGFPLPVFGLNSRLVSCLVVMVLAKARVVLTAQRSQVSKLATPLSDLSLESGERFDRRRKDAVSMFGMEVPASHTQQFRSDPGVASPRSIAKR